LVPWVNGKKSDKVAIRGATKGRLAMNIEPSEIQPEPAILSSNAVAQEVRCAVRFPLSLPVVLSDGNGEISAFTRDVSASGVLFELDQPLQEGTEIRFSLRMPRAILGAPHDVLVQCVGRVVRCSMSQSHYLAASTIDEYEFAEQ
jgi:PilZ domain